MNICFLGTPWSVTWPRRAWLPCCPAASELPSAAMLEQLLYCLTVLQSHSVTCISSTYAVSYGVKSHWGCSWATSSQPRLYIPLNLLSTVGFAFSQSHLFAAGLPQHHSASWKVNLLLLNRDIDRPDHLISFIIFSRDNGRPYHCLCCGLRCRWSKNPRSTESGKKLLTFSHVDHNFHRPSVPCRTRLPPTRGKWTPFLPPSLPSTSTPTVPR